MRGGHDRIEVVVDRRVRRGHVIVGGGTAAVDVGAAEEAPRGDGTVGDVELHRAGAAVGEVQAVVGARRRGEGRLLHVDRGQQQPVDSEGALCRGVDRVEAFHPPLRDVRLRGRGEARGVGALLHGRWLGEDSRRVMRAGASRSRRCGQGRGRRDQHRGRSRDRRAPDPAAEDPRHHRQAQHADRAGEQPGAPFGGGSRRARKRGGLVRGLLCDRHQPIQRYPCAPRDSIASRPRSCSRCVWPGPRTRPSPRRRGRRPRSRRLRLRGRRRRRRRRRAVYPPPP